MNAQFYKEAQRTLAEQFAIDEWLASYPSWATYQTILAMLNSDNHIWTHEDLTVWEVVENFPLHQVAEFIEATKSHFLRVTS